MGPSMSNLPDADKVGKALHYLATTDVEFAKLSAAVKALEHKGKVIRATTYLSSEGTIAEREARSLTSLAYKEFLGDLENTITDRETLAAHRKLAELNIDVWRSLNSARSKGQII